MDEKIYVVLFKSFAEAQSACCTTKKWIRENCIPPVDFVSLSTLIDIPGKMKIHFLAKSLYPNWCIGRRYIPAQWYPDGQVLTICGEIWFQRGMPDCVRSDWKSEYTELYKDFLDPGYCTPVMKFEHHGEPIGKVVGISSVDNNGISVHVCVDKPELLKKKLDLELAKFMEDTSSLRAIKKSDPDFAKELKKAINARYGLKAFDKQYLQIPRGSGKWNLMMQQIRDRFENQTIDWNAKGNFGLQEELVNYCKADVENTYKLYKEKEKEKKMDVKNLHAYGYIKKVIFTGNNVIVTFSYAPTMHMDSRDYKYGSLVEHTPGYPETLDTVKLTIRDADIDFSEENAIMLACIKRYCMPAEWNMFCKYFTGVTKDKEDEFIADFCHAIGPDGFRKRWADQINFIEHNLSKKDRDKIIVYKSVMSRAERKAAKEARKAAGRTKKEFNSMSFEDQIHTITKQMREAVAKVESGIEESISDTAKRLEIEEEHW